jgi:DNA polymerase V
MKVASSAEAKAAGKTMGEPFFNRKHCSGALVLFVSPATTSCTLHIMTTQGEMIPRIEIYSLNNAFWDLTGVSNCHDRVTSAKRFASSDVACILIG